MDNFLNKINFMIISAVFVCILASCNGGGQERVEETGDAGSENEALIEDNNIHYEVLEDENELQKATNEDRYNGYWDIDNDGFLEATEYGEGWSIFMPEEEFEENRFQEWDRDKDNFLDEEEFTEGMYGYYDENNDAVWDRTEFNGFSRSFYKNWDSDNDNEIAENEFKESWNNFMAANEYSEGMFEEWDSDNDNVLSKNEFADSMYDYWDTDDSGKIEKDEFQAKYY